MLTQVGAALLTTAMAANTEAIAKNFFMFVSSSVFSFICRSLG
jgi:hypothetical protein